ncbi:MAG: SIS domain-containing protein [Saccharofermentanales bacterium]|jgi:glucosamine--fructose-6-phosphate aminotransferase (isomerizing)
MNKLGKNTIVEIHQQVSILKLVSENIKEIEKIVKEVFTFKPEQVIFIGCGTSYYIAASASAYFQRKTGILARHLSCFELELHSDIYIGNKRTIVVPFSRLGSTSEVISVVKKVKLIKNVKVLAISCDEYSYEYNDQVILCKNISEKSIVMTSSFTAMLYTAMLMANVVSEESYDEMLKLHDLVQQTLNEIDQKAKQIAEKVRSKKLFICLAQGIGYGIAGECSIKIKEMCLIPTEIYYTLEYRHGPISLADENVVAMFIATPETSDQEIKMIEELKNYGIEIIVSGLSIADRLKKVADYYFNFEGTEEFLPVLTIPGQLLGTYWAISKDLDPDYPRNLSPAIVLDE